MIRKKRKTNVELFRIFLMMMIIAHHYVVNSGITDLWNSQHITFNLLFLELIGWGGKCGINCFILITGFFMCKQKFSWMKFIKLALEIEFYSVVIYLLFVISDYTPFSIKDFSKSILIIPLVIGKSFVGGYIVLYLLIPFINATIAGINKKMMKQLIIILLCVYSIIPTLLYTHLYEYIGWYITVYLIGAYLRLYSPSWMSNTKKVNIFLLTNFLLVGISILIMNYIDARKGNTLPWDIYYFVNDSNKILAISTAVCLFVFFNHIKIGYIPFINKIALTTFGVFLIHAHSDTMRTLLWKDWLNVPSYYNNSMLWLHAITSVLIVYTICAAIDYLRIILLERPFFKFFQNRVQKNIC